MPPRRPLPQPVEETKRSNRATPTKDRSADTADSKPRSTLPQPTESSTKHSKRPLKADSASHERDINHDIHPAAEGKHSPPPTDTNLHPPKPRRFTPQHIETTRRSRKNTDVAPTAAAAAAANSTTKASSGNQIHLSGQTSSSPVSIHESQPPQPPESKFSSSKLAERAAERRHSFRVPDLPTVKSQPEPEDSNISSTSSLSSSPSDGAERTKRRESRERRESQDERFSGYLLRLAAAAAEKQFREQAMAAYPNENMHEPVDHYAIDRDSEESDVEEGVGKLSMDGAEDEPTNRLPDGHRHRDSGSGWEMAEMRKHQDQLKEQKETQWAAEGSEFGRRRSVKSPIHDAAAQKAVEAAGAAPRQILGWQKDNEMKPMRHAASPPMAGEDLKFPKCLSPRNTHVDVNQYPGMKKKVSGAEERQHTGLWSPRDGGNREKSVSGLWMGVNAASAQQAIAPPRAIQSGLLTPGVERPDPFKTAGDYDNHQLPPSPPNSQEENKLDGILHREKSIEAEFDDSFVTQVYNYLSLGYPSLARKFDEELSKITKLPVGDLQKDDTQTNAKGYVGAPEGTGQDVRGVQGGTCKRWLALRAYVREWARQQPEMGPRDEAANGDWGARARKGSWAI